MFIYRLLLYIFITTSLTSAQSFIASVSSNKVGLEDQLQVSFTFSGDEINSLSALDAPSFENFVILSGPNVSTSMQIINSAVSASKTWSYYLQARNTGKFTIGSATIRHSTGAHKTNPLTIEVVAGSVRPKQDKEDSGVSNQEIAENLFIRAFADKHKAYVGEQVTVTYKLYTRLNIASQMSVSKLPSYQGFWAEEIESANNISFTTEVLDGKQFKVGILKKAALFPNQTGELSVTPFELVVPVQVQRKRRSNNPFDDFFNDPFFSRGETIEYTAKSNTIKVQAVALPLQDKPESFKGAVGQYSLNASADKLETKTNEPVTLKLEITGTGNIKLLESPEVKLPSGFDKYEPKVSEQINRGSQISGKKSIEYLLIPRTVGRREIPPVEFSYFDPIKKNYVTLNTPSYTINIEQGSLAYSQDYSGKEDVRLLGDDIRFIKTSTELNKRTGFIINKPVYWATAVLPLFALLGLIAVKKRNDTLKGNQKRFRYLKAKKIAQGRLKLAKTLMDQGKENDFYTEVSQALTGYLEDKLHILNSEFSIEKTEEELVKRNINYELIEQIKQTSEKCEYIRFAPGSNGAASMNNIYNEAASVIINLERELEDRKNG